MRRGEVEGGVVEVEDSAADGAAAAAVAALAASVAVEDSPAAGREGASDMFRGSQRTLDQLVAQLKSAHGDALLGVLVYGSTAADASATRGHNVAVVVRALDVRAMH